MNPDNTTPDASFDSFTLPSKLRQELSRDLLDIKLQDFFEKRALSEITREACFFVRKRFLIL